MIHTVLSHSGNPSNGWGTIGNSGKVVKQVAVRTSPIRVFQLGNCVQTVD